MAPETTLHALLIGGTEAEARALEQTLAATRGLTAALAWARDAADGLERLQRGGIDVTLLRLDARTAPDLVLRLVEALPRMPLVALVDPDDEAIGVGAVRDGAVDCLQVGRLHGATLALALVNAIERHRTKTDLARSTRLLRTSQSNYKKLINASADGWVIVSTDGAIQFANPAAAALLGATPQALEGRRFPFLTEAGRITEVRLGDERTAEMQVVETEWDGRPAMLASLRDVTDRRKLQQSLEEANRKLRELDQLKTLFLSKASHELRTPVAAIKGFAENLLDGALGPLQPTQRTSIERIKSNAGRLQHLIEDLLTLGRLEMGHARLQPAPLDLPGFLEHLAMDFAAQAQRQGITLRTELPDGAMDLQADAGRIRQVLDNLVHNALKFTPKGGSIVVSVREEADGGAAIFTVADTGPGIPEDEQLKIFERFYQGGRVNQAAPEGSGLGLTIAREIVELHGGTLWVESRVGEGSRFRFRLPLRATRGPRRLRVLVVDDDAAARRTLELTLQRARLPTEVRAAANGQEALERLEEGPADIVFSDIRMPVMDGLELLREIKRRTPEIPVVMVTAFRDLYHAKELIEAGADEYLTRPFSPAQVASILDKMHALRREREAERPA
jgi:signal transduction histidine kinase/ActR/RegA family two-component response regulator